MPEPGTVKTATTDWPAGLPEGRLQTLARPSRQAGRVRQPLLFIQGRPFSPQEGRARAAAIFRLDEGRLRTGPRPSPHVRAHAAQDDALPEAIRPLVITCLELPQHWNQGIARKSADFVDQQDKRQLASACRAGNCETERAVDAVLGGQADHDVADEGVPKV